MQERSQCKGAMLYKQSKAETFQVWAAHRHISLCLAAALRHACVQESPPFCTHTPAVHQPGGQGAGADGQAGAEGSQRAVVARKLLGTILQSFPNCLGTLLQRMPPAVLPAVLTVAALLVLDLLEEVLVVVAVVLLMLLVVPAAVLLAMDGRLGLAGSGKDVRARAGELQQARAQSSST